MICFAPLLDDADLSPRVGKNPPLSADPFKHAFQYVDWQFERDDLIAVSRTAFDDAFGGAANQHDANYLTFHRIERFRSLNSGETIPNP